MDKDEPKLSLAQLQTLVEEQRAAITELKKQLNDQQALIATLKNENTLMREKGFPPLQRPAPIVSTPNKTKDDTQQRAKRTRDDVASSNENSFNETPLVPTTKKIEKPPPITVHNVKNFKDFQSLVIIQSAEDVPTTTKTLANGNMLIITHNAGEYRRVISLLKSSGYEYHHYQLKAEKPFRVMIRGLNPSTDLDLIKEDLSNLGHDIRNVNNVIIKRKKGDEHVRVPLPLFSIELEPKANNKDIMDIKYLAYQKVKVEPPRPNNEIPQCKRCQKFGHTRNYCAMTPRCVKCAGDHETDKCTAKKVPSPKCANCEGAHPASWKGCPAYQARKHRGKAEPKLKTNPSIALVTTNRTVNSSAVLNAPATSASATQTTRTTQHDTRVNQAVSQNAGGSTSIEKTLSDLNCTLLSVCRRLERLENAQFPNRGIKKTQ